jgi:hypothetical protein
MTSSADAAQQEEMVQVFGFKGCPLQEDKCPKAKQWLGSGKQRFYSERRCRQAVYDHLMNSPFHAGMGSVEAASLAFAAEVEAWEIPAEDTPERVAEMKEWEEELVYFDDPSLQDSVNSAKKNKGGGKGKSKDDVGGHSSGQMVPSRKRPTEPAEAPPGTGTVSRQMHRVSSRLEQNIRQQTQNAYSFVQSMGKAEAALRTAARVSESAHRTFMDILILM